MCSSNIFNNSCRYDGTITAVSAAGNFIVTFDHYNVQEEVEKDSIKERRVERSIEEGGGYKGGLFVIFPVACGIF